MRFVDEFPFGVGGLAVGGVFLAFVGRFIGAEGHAEEIAAEDGEHVGFGSRRVVDGPGGDVHGGDFAVAEMEEDGAELTAETSDVAGGMGGFDRPGPLPGDARHAVSGRGGFAADFWFLFGRRRDGVFGGFASGFGEA